MKNLTAAVWILLLTLSAVTGFSQNRKSVTPSLFDGYPAIINCTEAQLSSLFIATKGQNINLALPGNFMIAGPVASNLVKYSNLQTVNIKLASFDNTLFSLSRQTDKNKFKTYAGRILNPLYADGFELKRNAEGNYQLIKIDVQKIVVNCNQ